MSKEPKKVGILTYCHNCHAVYTQQHQKCFECESESVVIFVAGDTIRAWLEYESAYDRMLDVQCGCCDRVIGECGT